VIGKSLLPTLCSAKSGRVDEERDFVMSALKFHAGCRPGRATFPCRASHAEKWTYIINYVRQRPL
jgi:N-sulfoglucosamine sulfohydrolase